MRPLSFKEFLTELDTGNDPQVIQLTTQLNLLQQQLARMVPQRTQMEKRYNDLKARIDRIQGQLALRQNQQQRQQQNQQQTTAQQPAAAAPNATANATTAAP